MRSTIYETRSLSPLMPQRSLVHPLSILFLSSTRNGPRQIYKLSEGHAGSTEVVLLKSKPTNRIQRYVATLKKQVLSLTMDLVKGRASVKRNVISHQLL